MQIMDLFFCRKRDWIRFVYTFFVIIIPYHNDSIVNYINHGRVHLLHFCLAGFHWWLVSGAQDQCWCKKLFIWTVGTNYVITSCAASISVWSFWNVLKAFTGSEFERQPSTLMLFMMNIVIKTFFPVVNTSSRKIYAPSLVWYIYEFLVPKP